MKELTAPTAPPSWLEQLWAEREERLYPAMFGRMRGIFPIPPTRFEGLSAPYDPRWLFIGVFECAPTAARRSWLYVTSGLSNPWDDEADPEDATGYGCEFAIETAQQGDWAIVLLHHLASTQLVAVSGRGGEPLGRGDRVGLHGPIDNAASMLRSVLITEPTSFAPELKQRSGVADWLFCVGISDEEKARARAGNNEALLAELAATGAFPVTDPLRATLGV